MNKNVTKEVMEQYKKVRKSGICNMFDFYCVQNAAFEMDYQALAWLGLA